MLFVVFIPDFKLNLSYLILSLSYLTLFVLLLHHCCKQRRCYCSISRINNRRFSSQINPPARTIYFLKSIHSYSILSHTDIYPLGVSLCYSAASSITGKSVRHLEWVRNSCYCIEVLPRAMDITKNTDDFKFNQITSFIKLHIRLPKSLELDEIFVFIGFSKSSLHDDVLKWKHFRVTGPFVRGIHQPPVNSPHKGQWRGVWCSLWYVSEPTVG